MGLRYAARVVFAKQLREGVRRGRIRCSIRIWQKPHVKVGGRYPMDEGRMVVDSIETILGRAAHGRPGSHGSK